MPSQKERERERAKERQREGERETKRAKERHKREPRRDTAAVSTRAYDSGKSSEGQQNSISVKKSNGELLGRKGVEGGFLTNHDQWRQVKIKFDLKKSNCDVELDDKKVIDNVKFKV